MSDSFHHRLSLALLGVAVLALPAAWYYVFLVAPTERTMGVIQRIFYIHLPSAFLAFLCFFVVFLASFAYLLTRRLAWDRVGVSAAEVGTVFCGAVLITGPIWAKPVWGIWWTWDARLTTTLILFLIYVAYLMLRMSVTESDRRARLSAVVGIIGFVDVIIVYKATDWWRGQHPERVIGGGGMDPRMWTGVVLAFFGLLVFAALLFLQRYRLESMRAELTELARRARV